MTFQRAINDSQQPASAATAVRAVAPLAAPAPEPVSGRIGRITYLAADAAWPSGAAPLARWLRDNPDVLGDLLGVKLHATADEVPGGLAGSVFVDQAAARTLAVLELGASSELMFGSLLTRLSTVQAGTAVWICGQPRDEHLSAVSWLNHSVAARFYVARIRAARIEASEPAPVLELVVRPPRIGGRTQPERGRRRPDAAHERP